MKACVDCINCIYSGRMYRSGKKRYECRASCEIKYDFVTGEKEYYYIDCAAERLAGKCGEAGKNFKPKIELNKTEEKLEEESSDRMGVFGLPESIGGGIGFF